MHIVNYLYYMLTIINLVDFFSTVIKRYIFFSLTYVQSLETCLCSVHFGWQLDIGNGTVSEGVELILVSIYLYIITEHVLVRLCLLQFW